MAQTLLELFHAKDYSELSGMLTTLYVANKAEVMRRERMRERIELYEDRGLPYLYREINNAYASEVASEFCRFAELALAHNLSRRIIDESSVVYNEAARRTVITAAGNPEYQNLQKLLRMDSRLKRANRLTNLANSVLLYPYYVKRADKNIPALEVITPDSFYVITDPLFPSQVVGYILDCFPTYPGALASAKHYLVMSESEVFYLNKIGAYVPDSAMPHDLGRMPAVLMAKDPARPVDGSSAADIPRGHLASALQQVRLLRDQQVGCKTLAVTGADAGTVQKNQIMDPKNILFFPGQSSIAMIGPDFAINDILKAQDAILQQTAASYGLTLDLLNQDYKATSGYEINLKRISLREKRREQILYCRDAERELAELQALLSQRFDSANEFEFDGWRIDFAEFEVPSDPLAEQALFEQKSARLLTNTVSKLMADNPDLSPEQALEELETNAKIEMVRLNLQTNSNQSLTSAVGNPGSTAKPANQNQARAIAERILGAR